MSSEVIAGKRYPRGLTRKRYVKDGKKLPCTYLDLGRLPRNKGKEENKRSLAEFEKMAGIS